MNRDSIVLDWTDAVRAFNSGDTAPMSTLYAPEVAHHSSRGPVGTGRQQVIGSYKAIADTVGWTQHIIAIAAAGEFFTVLYRNVFGDGTAHIGGGIHRIAPDGLINEVYSMAPRDWIPQSLTSR